MSACICVKALIVQGGLNVSEESKEIVWYMLSGEPKSIEIAHKFTLHNKQKASITITGYFNKK